MRRWVFAAAGLSLTIVTSACGGGEGDSRAATRIDAGSDATVLTALDGLPGGLGTLLEPAAGDLDSLRARRLVRFLTVADPMFYGVDGRHQGGMAFEAAQQLQDFVNQRLGIERPVDRIRVIIVPVRRDQLLPLLAEGRAEIAAANLTVTEERSARVAFSEPTYRNATEIVVTGPGGPAIDSVGDISGHSVFVRPSSSFRESLETVNRGLEAAGREPARIVPVDEILENADILQLVERGDIPLTVVDRHIAEFWKQFFPAIVLHSGVALREDGDIAWALRPDAPDLKELVNAFVRQHRVGALLGNVLVQRYVQSPSWARSVRSFVAREDLARFEPVFREAGQRYGFDWRLLAAQAIQESGLDPQRRSAAGAIGLMQLMPATAEAMSYQGDLTDPEGNVLTAAKYLAHVLDVYFPDLRDADSIQAQLIALAAYNAGPTRIARLRTEAAARGFDSDRWFDGMELVVAREVGMEPVNYVANIVKSFVAFQLGAELVRERARALEKPPGG
jgi:membrane-bound lytic murein transglycosylase MltF